MALDPDQSPLAEQLEALDELQVSVTLELIETELESDDKESDWSGWVPVSELIFINNN